MERIRLFSLVSEADLSSVHHSIQIFFQAIGPAGAGQVIHE